MSIRVATSNNTSIIMGQTPTNIGQYTPFTINNGPEIPCYIEDSKLKFNENITYTTITGVTRTVNLSSIDASSLADGTYKIVLPNEGTQPSLINALVENGSSQPLPTYKELKTDYNFYVANNKMYITAGSVLPFPDGLNADGTKKFVYRTLPSDVEFFNTTWSTGQAQPCITYNTSTGNFGFYTYYTTQWFFQTTQPTTTDGMWYNPQTNLIKVSAGSGASWVVPSDFSSSLPIGIATHTSGTGFTALEATWTSKNHVWVDTKQPYTTKIKNATVGYDTWSEYEGTILTDSAIVVSSGAVTSISSMPQYNNGTVEVNGSYVGKMGKPGNRYIDLSLGASGVQYVAPANGWFYIRKYTASTNQFVGLYVASNGSGWKLASMSVVPTSNMDSAVCVPARKGDKVSCYYSMGGTTSEFRFVYDEGEA